LKFKTIQDAQMFLIDIGQFYRVSDIDETFKPTKEELDEFIKRRSKLMLGLKDFRKSQQQKSNWRKNRAGIMKGIKKFHKSTAGKRFHRNLGRFLVSRISGESLDYNIYDTLDFLKGISSCRTHLYIEESYYMTLYDYIEFISFREDVLKPLFKLEESFSNLNTCILDDYELDCLLSLIDLNELSFVISESLGLEKEIVYNFLDKDSSILLNEVKKIVLEKKN
jgi:hypothetical protein